MGVMIKTDKYKKNARQRIIGLIEEFCYGDPDRKQQAFADMCHIGKASVSQYVSGSNAPGNVTAAKIGKACGVEPLWVMGFDVPRNNISDSERFGTFAKLFNDTHFEEPSQQEKVHFTNYRKLNEKYRAQIDELVNQLLTVQEQEEKAREAENIKCYPFYNRIAAAGTGFYFEDIPIDTKDAPAKEGADFIVGVSGDSMEPTFYDRDDVYVHSTSNINIGDIGLFILNNECFIKELGLNRLISHNKKYADISGDIEVKCVGKVLGKVEY